jgi:fluoride ion exporter CrcB/FEX
MYFIMVVWKKEVSIRTVTGILSVLTTRSKIRKHMKKLTEKNHNVINYSNMRHHYTKNSGV